MILRTFLLGLRLDVEVLYVLAELTLKSSVASVVIVVTTGPPLFVRSGADEEGGPRILVTCRTLFALLLVSMEMAQGHGHII